jgi:hypothetical protein
LAFEAAAIAPLSTMDVQEADPVGQSAVHPVRIRSRPVSNSSVPHIWATVDEGAGAARYRLGTLVRLYATELTAPARIGPARQVATVPLRVAG